MPHRTYAALVAEARAQQADHPQYGDAFDDDKGWSVGTARRTFSTKGGRSFWKGHDYLVKVESDPDHPFCGFTFAYSNLRAISVLVPKDLFAKES